MSPMIQVQDLCKIYSNHAAVDSLTFAIEPGETVGILGREGAGKSTLLRMLAAYTEPSSGHIYIAGTNMYDHRKAALRHLGYLPDTPPLYMDMTVDAYLMFVYRLKKVRAGSAADHIADVCRTVDLSLTPGQDIGSLSHVAQYRLGLAQALIGDPDVLLLDEPPPRFSPRQLEDTLPIMHRLAQGRTLVLASQLLGYTFALCNRILVLSAGRLAADSKDGPLPYSNEQQVLFLRAGGTEEETLPLLSRLTGIQRVRSQGEQEPHSRDYTLFCRPGTDIRPALFTILSEAGIPILTLSRREPDWDDFSKALSQPPEQQRPKARTLPRPAELLAARQKETPNRPPTEEILPPEEPLLPLEEPQTPEEPNPLEIPDGKAAME